MYNDGMRRRPQTDALHRSGPAAKTETAAAAQQRIQVQGQQQRQQHRPPGEPRHAEQQARIHESGARV